MPRNWQGHLKKTNVSGPLTEKRQKNAQKNDIVCPVAVCRFFGIFFRHGLFVEVEVGGLDDQI
jgi:hypothetical protein